MLPYLRFLAGRERSEQANRHLGFTLAFVAGAVNAGGFLALGRYTSHVTGVMSEFAQGLSVGQARLALAAAAIWLAFAAGAAACAVLVVWARRRGRKSQYALVLVVEAALLVVFALSEAAAFGALLLSFVMGLQNAVITKLSDAEIRTTHMTGNTTDLGIQLGRAVYWDRGSGQPVRADVEKLKIHACLVSLFVAGGVIGAAAFQASRLAAILAIALLLLVVASGPVLEDAFGAER